MSMSFAESCCTKGQAHITAIMRLKSSTLGRLALNQLVIYILILNQRSDSWYQFNDEEVTRIDKLGDKRSTRKVDIGVDDTTDEK